MYLPNLIPADLHIDWANPSTISNPRTKTGREANGFPNSRKSDFPPLSYYTPGNPVPVHTNSASKRIYANLRQYRNNLNTNENTDFEGLEHMSLELANRTARSREIETWGYNWIRPHGINKTMSQLIEEAKNDEESSNGRESVSGDDDGNDEEVEDLNEDSNDAHNNTHLMAENFGHIQPTELNIDNSANNNITVESTNQTDANMNIDNLVDDHIVEDEERDLDAEISNHDISNNLSGISEYEEYDDAFYEDEEDLNDMEDADDDDDDDAEEEEGDIAIVQDESLDLSLINPESEHMVQSSFDNGLMNLLETNKKKIPAAEDEYFMAYEEYQDDHSILDDQRRNTNVNSRVVSISDSAFTRRSHGSEQRYADSANITTANTLNSAVARQSTGNTSVDEHNLLYTSDFDMTLE